MDYYSPFCGPKTISMVVEPQGVLTCWSSGLIVYVTVINTDNSGRFWSVSCTITQRFGVPERFPRLTNPGVHLRVDHQHSWFLSFWTRFVDYYSPFCGPKTISMVVEPQGVLTCWSSGLIVYVSVINTDNSGRFWSVSCTITQRFGVPERFPRLMIPGVRLRVRHQHS